MYKTQGAAGSAELRGHVKGTDARVFDPEHIQLLLNRPRYGIQPRHAAKIVTGYDPSAGGRSSQDALCSVILTNNNEQDIAVVLGITTFKFKSGRDQRAAFKQHFVRMRQHNMLRNALHIIVVENNMFAPMVTDLQDMMLADEAMSPCLFHYDKPDEPDRPGHHTTQEEKEYRVMRVETLLENAALYFWEDMESCSSTGDGSPCQALCDELMRYERRYVPLPGDGSRAIFHDQNYYKNTLTGKSSDGKDDVFDAFSMAVKVGEQVNRSPMYVHRMQAAMESVDRSKR